MSTTSPKKAVMGEKIGTLVRKLDKRFGVVAVLNGEPRPPRGGFDLEGEKLIDWGWICANLPPGTKRALEIGPGKSPIIPAMLAMGYEVTAVDSSYDPRSLVDGFRFVHGDFNDLPSNDFACDQRFDVIVLCSVVEHLGLAGRYNSKADPDADLRAMRRIHVLLEPLGKLLLTIPVGRDAVHAPWHRVYGRERLPGLLEGFRVVKSRFLQKKPGGAWYDTTEDNALDTPVDIRRYALGEMVLEPAL
jgi:SAM-dependent methyltransferase